MLTDAVKVAAALVAAVVFLLLFGLGVYAIYLGATLGEDRLTTTQGVLDCMQDRDERRTK